MTQAYVVERANGEIVGYNCKVTNVNGLVTVSPYEEIVNAVHFNLKKDHKASVKFIGKPASEKEFLAGMHWLK